MSGRKYSIDEIDRMRRAVRTIEGHQPGFRLRGGKADYICEERLRTYMLNGTAPEELETEADRRAKELGIPRFT